MLCFSGASVHPVPSTSLSLCSSTDTIVPTLYTDGASVHLVLKTLRPSCLCKLSRGRQIDRRFLLTKASVHPVLKTSSWHVSVLIQTECRIDQRCPCLLRPSDHSVLPSLQFFICNSSDASRNWTVGSSDGVNFVFSTA
jgi:hypothetical protein